MSDPVIETMRLTKNYGKVEAVKGIDLSVPRGSVYGFLGRNGAGKTTTIKMLLGLVKPSGGEGRVFGRRIDRDEQSIEIRARTGFVSEDKGLYDYMTVKKMIDFTRPFFPGWRMDLEREYVTLFDLPLGRKIKTLSKGMRTKLALLLALARGAELLLLDEPTEGLDPAMIEDVLQCLIKLGLSRELTIFFSSHQIAEVEQIADHLCIIDHGQIVVEGALDDIKQNHRRINLVFNQTAPDAKLSIDGIEKIEKEGRSLSILTTRNVEEIINYSRVLNPVSIDVVPMTLKEIFLETVKDSQKQPDE